ncbi:hypothetical protein AB0B10_25340 [Micromonospora arborensis]|uniref:hypothetical protein n=1 Tax=Micromonospora arborensis TaxID=2116518 RepID=UPI00340B2840
MTHPLTPGVAWVITRHLGPYKRCLWRQLTLSEAADRSAFLDRRRRGRGRPG